MSFSEAIDSRQRHGAILYLGVLLALIAAAWLGWLPGSGQVYPGEPLTAHPYRVTMAAACGLLAAWLGFESARFGAARGSIPAGLAALVAGGVATGILLGFAPYTLYPGDQYPVSFLWVVLGAPMGLGAWVAATLLQGRRALSFT